MARRKRKIILPPNKPRMGRSKIEEILIHSKVSLTVASLVFIRGYFLNTLGRRNKNDLNVYDDACFLISPSHFSSYNANTDPNRMFRGSRALAKVSLGVYQFYRGLHRGKYKALRAFPEGSKLSCTRNGRKSTCSYINIHKGSSNQWAFNVTHSDGCFTIPSIQYGAWRLSTWLEMRNHTQDVGKVWGSNRKLIDVVLVENKQKGSKQRIVDHRGNVII